MQLFLLLLMKISTTFHKKKGISMKNSMYILCIGLLGTSVSARMVVPEDESKMSCPKIITNDINLLVPSEEKSRERYNQKIRSIFSSEKAVRPKNADSKKSLEQLFPFEIEYKNGDNPILIDIDNGGCRIVEQYQLGSKKQNVLADVILRLPSENIDTNKEITISIYRDRQNFAMQALGLEKPTKKQPNYDQVYTINANGKTVYLKWENDKLQTRVGSTFGSKTPSGLSVKNNVKAGDIRQEKVVGFKPSPKPKKLPFKIATTEELKNMNDQQLMETYNKYSAIDAKTLSTQDALSLYNAKKTLRELMLRVD